MMKKFTVVGLLVVSALLESSSVCLADQRAYVWTYEYMTLPRGATELESYTTISTPDVNKFEGITSTEQQLELEVGMTDRFDFAIYQVFIQEPESDLRYKGYKLRARYRFGEKDKYPLDPLVYAEYKGKPDFSEHGIELKLVLAKDIGRLNIALNPILELEREDGEWEAEPEYAVGLSFGIVDELLRLGIEGKGSEHGHYVGPVISHGRQHAWMTLGSAIKASNIDEGKPELQVRLVVGIGLSD
ncbi:MAG: hypothetical protein JSW58_15670 [Candidatus Latescibacterota bacterium]|nr:MAG: hypothetical protein JSW58_15670 [Candidatus Latescibacterota bacterium]